MTIESIFRFHIPVGPINKRTALFISLFAASCATFGADKRRTDAPQQSIAASDITGIAKVMIEFARKATTPSALVRAITGTSPSADPSTEYWTYHHGAFESTDGYVVTDLEVRVRPGGFDTAPFILLHLSGDPCLPLESFARATGAVSEVFFPPSPHAANSTSARGYELVTANGGKLVISSRGKSSPSCVTLITASPTDGRTQGWTPQTPGTRTSPEATSTGSSSNSPGMRPGGRSRAGNDLPTPGA
ncbi:hypothetical protein [Luteimonas lutimaris]|uniref:hypothetical protein n=1 Tax=Luteimonas lutimaris TaxID=698645 RepID=UPI002D502E1E|nr:hypothetical protein [Luteimonas sp.]